MLFFCHCIIPLPTTYQDDHLPSGILSRVARTAFNSTSLSFLKHLEKTDSSCFFGGGELVTSTIFLLLVDGRDEGGGDAMSSRIRYFSARQTAAFSGNLMISKIS